MPDLITPQIVPPQDSQGNNLGGTWGTPTRPWSAGFFHALFSRGKAVATLDSPRFIGEPKVVTPGAEDNTERIANTSWVRTFVSSIQLASSNITGLATGVLTWLQTPSSANLRAAVTDETGTGNLVFATSPTLVTPVLGAATATSINGLTIDTTTGTLDLVNGSTLATAGAHSITLTATGSTNVTLPTSGTLATANTDTALATGTANAVTAAALRTHLDASGLHREINDSAVSATGLWSSNKINTELSTINSTISGLPTPPTNSSIISTIYGALESGGGITWSTNAGVSITPATSGLLKADGTVAGTGRQELLRLNFTDPTTLTILAGSVTSTRSLHVIAAETGTADDLVNIESAETGDILLLTADTGDTITLKHGTGNLLCSGGADLTLSGYRVALAQRYAAGWIVGLLNTGAAGSGDALVGNTLAQFAATTSAQLAGVISDETGTGALVFADGPTLGSIELGHASDTTIARSEAGVVTIEGVEVVTLSRTQTLTNKTLVAPALGTPTSGNLSACTNIPGAQIVAQREVLVIAASDEVTHLTTGTAKATFRMPFAMTLTAVRASLTTAQASGSILTVDINEAGSSILSTKLTIDNTAKTSTTATTPFVISDTALADDAEITIDIDQVGTAGATGLKVYLIGTRA